MSRGRRGVVRLFAALGLVTYSLPFIFVTAEAGGILTSSPVGSPQDPAPSPEALAGAAAPGELIHLVGAAGALVVGASGLIGLLVRPQWAALSRQVLAVTVALVVVVPVVGDPDNVGGQAAVIDPAFLLLTIPPLVAALLARPFRRPPPGARRPVLAILAVVALPIAGWWSFGQALNQRNTFPPTADPHHQAHWHVMAVFALAVVLAVAAAALADRGWRLGAITAGLSTVAYGVASLAAPEAASAVAFGWSAAAVMWGLGVVTATVVDVTRDLRARDVQAPARGGGDRAA